MFHLFCPNIAILDRIKRNNDEGAKTHHFIIIETGGRGGSNVPFILSKIVVPVHYQRHEYGLFPCVTT